MRRLIILPAARDDLADIADFIAQDNPTRALSFLEEIELRLRSTTERPESFPARNNLATGLRCARHGKYLIFFLHTDEEVRIVRILHGLRDLAAEL
ncbi:toxin ParE1/3/4 [Roseibium suaedae]|uniref:Toxin ParE1/3/4 n=1 Tax=Roseibium suaedae TaxID=735517 RepID=A0A1M6ZAY1_9HYPH|nr:toxin ParE1/3/4 [Roseibium suaedae]